MKSLLKRRTLIRRDYNDFSLIFFFIFGLMFIGYTIDFIIFMDWSFLYVTCLAPLIFSFRYKVKSKEKKPSTLTKD